MPRTSIDASKRSAGSGSGQAERALAALLDRAAGAARADSSRPVRGDAVALEQRRSNEVIGSRSRQRSSSPSGRYAPGSLREWPMCR